VGATHDATFAEFTAALQLSAKRVSELASVDVDQLRGVGRKQLPTSVGGLLVHVADHTQRHVGQAVTTTKIVVAQGG